LPGILGVLEDIFPKISVCVQQYLYMKSVYGFTEMMMKLLPQKVSFEASKNCRKLGDFLKAEDSEKEEC
jgi:hypothetical protein